MEMLDCVLLRIDNRGAVVVVVGVAGARVGWYGGGELITELARSKGRVGVLGLGLDTDMLDINGVLGGEMSMARSCATVMLAPCLGIIGANGSSCWRKPVIVVAVAAGVVVEESVGVEAEAAAAATMAMGREANKDWARTACSSDLLHGMFSAAAACWTASGVIPIIGVAPS